MTAMTMHPYIFFTNTARAAMTRYHEILGGDLDIMGIDGAPESDVEQMPFEVPEGFVMHAALKFGDGNLLLASDDPTGDGQGVKGMSINLTLTDQDEARRIFEALAEDGEIQMPLEATFWSPLFGTCTDRFGINWMVNIEHGEA